MDPEVISLNSLPEQLKEEALEQIKECSVGLVLDGGFVGSGTLIEWKGNRGVLTARHVVTESLGAGFDFGFNSRQRLHVIASDFPSASEFPVSGIVHIDLGTPLSEEFGPDLSVLQLPQTEQLGSLKAKKRFWQILSKTDEKFDAASSNRGFIAISGFPGERVTFACSRLGFEQTKLANGIVGLSQAKKYYLRNGFDYLEVGLEVGPDSIAPLNRGGLSGGGAWRVRVRKNADAGNILCIEDVTLAGVIFYDTDRNARKTTLRCHGPTSLYKSLVSKF